MSKIALGESASGPGHVCAREREVMLVSASHSSVSVAQNRTIHFVSFLLQTFVEESPDTALDLVRVCV